MRRFFHRKAATSRPTAAATTNGGQLGGRTSSPSHATSPTGRVRAPALRSRSMSVLSGPIPGSSPPSRRFTRSLSFCSEIEPAISSSCISRQLTTTEEDAVFETYTRRVYGLFGALCAIIVGFVLYAYFYNYGNR